MRLESSSHYDALTAPSRARKIIRHGDTIFATIRPSLRRIAQVPRELDNEVASTAFCVLRPNRAVIDPDYLFYSVCHDRFIGRVVAQQSGANYPAVRDKDVLATTISFPELSEQVQISQVLSRVRESALRQFALLECAYALKVAAMHQLFTRGLRGQPQKDTAFGPVPTSWDVEELGECAEVQTGAAKGQRMLDSEAIEVPYLRVANVQDGYIDLTEIRTIRIREADFKRYSLRSGDVLLTEGGDLDKLGRGFVWRGELEGCIHQNHVFAVRPIRDRIHSDFLAYLVQSAYGKAYFLKVAHKTTNLACINTAKLRAFPMLIPPLAEQHGIIDILGRIDQKIDLHKRKKATLDQLFNVLLNQLMTGKIRVSDLDLTALEIAPPETEPSHSPTAAATE
ncbi:MAG: restriction endonuclease subunit S [Candidatus Eremiobacteraeota bacterium]|nr:restriction endonuclease subunit S [Candidatus Eremiobacteraeota bacterium]